MPPFYVGIIYWSLLQQGDVLGESLLISGTWALWNRYHCRLCSAGSYQSEAFGYKFITWASSKGASFSASCGGFLRIRMTQDQRWRLILERAIIVGLGVVPPKPWVIWRPLERRNWARIRSRSYCKNYSGRTSLLDNFYWRNRAWGVPRRTVSFSIVR